MKDKPTCPGCGASGIEFAPDEFTYRCGSCKLDTGSQTSWMCLSNQRDDFRVLVGEARALLIVAQPAIRSRAQIEQYHGSEKKATHYSKLSHEVSSLISRMKVALA